MYQCRICKEKLEEVNNNRTVKYHKSCKEKRQKMLKYLIPSFLIIIIACSLFFYLSLTTFLKSFSVSVAGLVKIGALTMFFQSFF